MGIKHSLRRGFTLIELLVVVVIIGVLAVAFLPTVFSGPQKARDGVRKGHLSTLVTAIELFYNENGTLPGSAAKGCFVSGPIGPVGSANGVIDADFVDEYLRNELPIDPLGADAGSTQCPNGGYYYFTDSLEIPTCYAVAALLEVDKGGNLAGGTDFPNNLGCDLTPTDGAGDIFVQKVNL